MSADLSGWIGLTVGHVEKQTWTISNLITADQTLINQAVKSMYSSQAFNLGCTQLLAGNKIK